RQLLQSRPHVACRTRSHRSPLEWPGQAPGGSGERTDLGNYAADRLSEDSRSNGLHNANRDVDDFGARGADLMSGALDREIETGALRRFGAEFVRQSMNLIVRRVYGSEFDFVVDLAAVYPSL